MPIPGFVSGDWRRVLRLAYNAHTHNVSVTTADSCTHSACGATGAAYPAAADLLASSAKTIASGTTSKPT